MLIMLMLFIFPFFPPDVLKTEEMLIRLILRFSKKLAKTGHMLIRLIMLIFWEPWGGGVNPRTRVKY